MLNQLPNSLYNHYYLLDDAICQAIYNHYKMRTFFSIGILNKSMNIIHCAAKCQIVFLLPRKTFK